MRNMKKTLLIAALMMAAGALTAQNGKWTQYNVRSSEICSDNISAIATEVGFTPANLREQFKRKYGMTPVEYRQNL